MYQHSPDIMARFAWTVRVRIVAGVTVWIVLSVIHFTHWMKFPYLLFSIAPFLIIFVNQPYRWLVSRIRSHDLVFLVNQTLDVIIVTWGIHCLGGADMFVLVLLYPLIILFSAMALNTSRAFLLANMSFGAYATMVYFELSGVVPMYHTLDVEASIHARLTLLILTFLFLNLFAYFSSFFTAQLKKGEEEARRANLSLVREHEELLDALDTLSDVNKKLKQEKYESGRMNQLMVGREKKMIDLKKEINELLVALGKPPRYEE